MTRTEIKKIVSAAIDRARVTDPALADLLQQVKQAAGREVVLAMDPRKKVTIDEAYAIVYGQPPFAGLLAYAQQTVPDVEAAWQTLCGLAHSDRSHPVAAMLAVIEARCSPIEIEEARRAAEVVSRG